MVSSGYTRSASLASSSYDGGSTAVNRVLASYGNVFTSIANLYTPTSIKSLLNHCEHFAVMDPLIHAALTKMSAYPVTDLLYQAKEPHLNEFYQSLFDDIIDIRRVEIEALLDYYTYGNTFLTIQFPFRKMVTCQHCGENTPVNRTKFRWMDFKFDYECPKCKQTSRSPGWDRYLKELNETKIIRLNPKYVDLDYNPVTEKSTYFFTLPPMVQNAIYIGRRDVVTEIPQAYITAVSKNKRLQFRSGYVFHMKMPSISRLDAGWGVPLISAVFELAFYYRILKKAQEAVAMEHIIPFRVVFPQTASGENPYKQINLVDWTDIVQSHIAKWRKDPNHIATLAYPLGYQSIGGQGRALMLHNEMRLVADQILAGMGVPQEFVFGGLSYSGSSVSLRMLENTMLGARRDLHKFLRWLVSFIAAYKKVPEIPIKMKDFKMADDLQRAAFDFQLAQAKLISEESVVSSRDYDYGEEQARIKRETENKSELQEMLATQGAEIQGKAQLISTKYQVQAQAMMPQPMPPQQGPDGMMPPDQGGMPPEGGMVPEGGMQEPPFVMPPDPQKQMAEAEEIAAHLVSTPEINRIESLERFRADRPDIYPMILQKLQEQQRRSIGIGDPLPEQRPPRRGPEDQLI